MTSLTSPRNTAARVGHIKNNPLAAAVKVFGGSLLMRNAAGYITKGATATGCYGVGIAEATVDNSAGIAGAAMVDCREGCFLFANLGGGDLITQADIGKLCYIVDDQTVAKTDATGTRSRAGIVDGLEGLSVWVRFDEALTRAM